jgi:hypothetical protein
VTVSGEQFHGWSALILRNRTLEVMVVPAIGRVMGMALLGGAQQGEGPVWNNPELRPGLAPDDNGWINLGGDKAWPAPQSDWKRVTGKDWPPPRTFDSSPYTAQLEEGAVVLVSPVDGAYGVRVRRRLSLNATEPVLTIETSYEKVSGPPVRVGVWTITQLDAPEKIFMRLPAHSTFPDGFVRKLPARPKDLAIEDGLLSLARDREEKTMIASGSDALLWRGETLDLFITRADGHAAGEWADGAHAQIYTSPDVSGSYVELELLSPLSTLKIGERAQMTVRYTLAARDKSDPVADAKRLLMLR